MQNATRNGWLMLCLLCILTPLATFGQDASPLVHTVQKGDNLIKICGIYRNQTNHYALTDLLTDIRGANGLESNFLKIGQSLVIPVLDVEDASRVTERVAAGAELRGIYLTGPACGVSSVLRRVDSFIEAGGNAVVFDAKDIDGGVSYLSRHPLASYGAGRSGPVISSLDDMILRFDRRGLYIIARIALFLDGELGRSRPDLALQDPQGNPWTERGCAWIDPANEEVLEYNLALAVELAKVGVHEIQFDYMRFPTNGWFGDDKGNLAATGERRRQVIEAFLIRARSALAEYDVRISADLFGIMGWGRVEDLALTGQHVPTIAAQVDVICPMIYPSHFGPGFEGRRRPGDDPIYFVGEGTRRFFELAGGQAEIRPWLQAFPYRVSNYDEEYIRVQISAAAENGGSGWCLWNPACRYTVALNAIRPRDQISVLDALVTLDVGVQKQ
ncbi:MAG: LysM peptidoglycan-binding domain-containing protein [Gemmatimonadales bacterium]|nr:LysM peptidoglycan-binding domain-containing protein [Gemmatimonadales bacterium]